MSKRERPPDTMVAATVIPSTVCVALGSEAQRAACTPNVYCLCSSEIPSVDRIVACLRIRKASLSTGCQAVFNAPTEQTVTRRSLGGPERIGVCSVSK